MPLSLLDRLAASTGDPVLLGRLLAAGARPGTVQVLPASGRLPRAAAQRLAASTDDPEVVTALARHHRREVVWAAAGNPAAPAALQLQTLADADRIGALDGPADPDVVAVLAGLARRDPHAAAGWVAARPGRQRVTLLEGLAGDPAVPFDVQTSFAAALAGLDRPTANMFAGEIADLLTPDQAFTLLDAGVDAAAVQQAAVGAGRRGPVDPDRFVAARDAGLLSDRTLTTPSAGYDVAVDGRLLDRLLDRRHPAELAWALLCLVRPGDDVDPGRLLQTAAVWWDTADRELRMQLAGPVAGTLRQVTRLTGWARPGPIAAARQVLTGLAATGTPTACDLVFDLAAGCPDHACWLVDAVDADAADIVEKLTGRFDHVDDGHPVRTIVDRLLADPDVADRLLDRRSPALGHRSVAVAVACHRPAASLYTGISELREAATSVIASRLATLDTDAQVATAVTLVDDGFDGSADELVELARRLDG